MIRISSCLVACVLGAHGVWYVMIPTLVQPFFFISMINSLLILSLAGVALLHSRRASRRFIAGLQRSERAAAERAAELDRLLAESIRDQRLQAQRYASTVERIVLEQEQLAEEFRAKIESWHWQKDHEKASLACRRSWLEYRSERLRSDMRRFELRSCEQAARHRSRELNLANQSKELEVLATDLTRKEEDMVAWTKQLEEKSSCLARQQEETEHRLTEIRRRTSELNQAEEAFSNEQAAWSEEVQDCLAQFAEWASDRCRWAEEVSMRSKIVKQQEAAMAAREQSFAAQRDAWANQRRRWENDIARRSEELTRREQHDEAASQVPLPSQVAGNGKFRRIRLSNVESSVLPGLWSLRRKKRRL